jgi:hypothetical protein
MAWRSTNVELVSAYLVSTGAVMAIGAYNRLVGAYYARQGKLRKQRGSVLGKQRLDFLEG